MSATSHPIRYLPTSTGFARVYVLAYERYGYAKVKSFRSGITFQTLSERLLNEPVAA